MQKSFLGSGIPISVPQATTSLANLSDVNLTTPANSEVLTFSGSKWINAPAQGAQVSSVFGRVGAVVKNVNDYAITDIQNNSYLASDQNVTIASPLTGQTIRYDGAKFLNSKLSIDDLSNTSITTPQEADSLIYSSAGLGSWKNQKKYSEFFIYESIAPGSTVTAANKTIYFCNLATINFPSSVIGECVKVINTSGPLLTINFPGRILYFNSNNFNATLTTSESCEIVFEGILGGNWQVVSFTGKILNSVTGKNLANNDLNDLRNVVITTPANNQILRYNSGTLNWVNSAETVYYKKYTNYIKLTNQTVSLTNNTLYQSANSTINVGVSPAGTVFSVVNTSGTTTLSFDSNQYLLVFNSFEIGAFTLSTSEQTNINITCFSSDGFSSYYIIESSSGDWNFSLSTKKIGAYVDINTLKNVNISGPVSGQFLTYNGTDWTNTSLERCHPTSEIFIGGVGTTFAVPLTTVNVWYQFAHPTTIVNNPSAVGVFALNNANLLQWTYTGTNTKYYHSAVSISLSTDAAADAYELAIFINNVIVAGSQFSIDFANNNQITSTAFHKILTLNTNDIIDIRIRNVSTSGKTISTNNVNLCCLACCSLI